MCFLEGFAVAAGQRGVVMSRGHPRISAPLPQCQRDPSEGRDQGSGVPSAIGRERQETQTSPAPSRTG
jgi:hypothetical protein